MNLTIDKKYRSLNFTQGRPLGAPNVIVIHHWGIDGQNFDAVCAYLCRPNGNSSAHYVVEAGRVCELISPDHRAWHAGAKGNPRGIGIECRPECSEADREQVAQLVAYLYRRYGTMPITQHKDYMSTDCAGRWGAYLSWLKRRATEINTSPTQLEVDGWVGPKTVARLQQILQTPTDGVISGQEPYWRDHHTAITNAAIRYDYGTGSLMIEALQKKLGVAVDGVLGPETIKAWQRHLSVDPDSYLGHITARAIQTAANKNQI